MRAAMKEITIATWAMRLAATALVAIALITAGPQPAVTALAGLTIGYALGHTDTLLGALRRVAAHTDPKERR